MLKFLAFQHPDHRRARLFRNGKNQAVRIPKEFEFPVHKVILRRKGKSLVIEPIVRARSLLEILNQLRPIHEKFPNVDQGLIPLDSPQI